MECRVCHQPIVFVKGLYAGHKRRATLAIHEADAQRVIAQTSGEIVHPHPGMQRRLRQPLEEGHDDRAANAQAPPNEPSSFADLPASSSTTTSTTTSANTTPNNSGTGTVTEITDAQTFAEENIVQDEFAAGGSREMAEELERYNAVSPELTAGDIDADWQRAEASGEETPGGHAPTPDQDDVDEIGRAFGMELPDNQELYTHEELLAKRDRDRWELNRSSADGDSI